MTALLALAGLVGLAAVAALLWPPADGPPEDATTAPTPVEPEETPAEAPEEVPEEPGAEEPPEELPEEEAPEEEAPEEEAPEADTAPEPDAGAEPGTPEGWTRVPVGPAGASVAHPEGWEQVAVSATIVDYRAGSGTYLRTDWTDSPAGDPVADWERQAASFAARREAYEQLRLEPATVAGHQAAIWEYAYRADGRELRAINVNILTGSHAYALNVQAPAAEWGALEPTVEQIVASFAAEA